ncbi:major facilitator superfamily domain-containing protein [Mycena latifolia]|nr:major facilitator superfamily domain-containing protein [Mycena latifolia]
MPSSTETELCTTHVLLAAPDQRRQPKSRAFWMSFIAIMVATFLSALDLAAIGTALPTIAAALHDTKGDYIWVGAAYAVSSTAFIPLSGSLANAFGRKSIMLICIACFSLGSALAGSAKNMNVMIAARTIQGIGGGGIFALTEIITADLVPLAERGLYQGINSLVWSLASSIGPPIGGALSYKGSMAWRWLFYLNLPLTGIAFVLVLIYLFVRTPEGSVRSKLAHVDWIGNAFCIIGTGLAVIGLTWGGIRYAWSSVQVLAPLSIGLGLLIVFAVYEATLATHPTIPRDVVANRTSLSGLLTTAAQSIITITMMYYLPVFFQACFAASPIQSAVDYLPTSLVASPFAFLAGVLVTMLKQYSFVNWAAWVITAVAFGLFSTFRADSAAAAWAGYQVMGSIGIGMLFSAPIFAVLAPLPKTRAASALALFSFTRAFFQTWGIAISSTILQNMLEKKLPAAFVAQFPPGFEIAYAAIPVIRELDEPLRMEVQRAFAESMSVMWQTMAGIAALGFLLSLLMKEIPMVTTVDDNYALKDIQADVVTVEKI